LLVMRSIKKRHTAFLRKRAQVRDRNLVRFQLGAIAATEFLETRRIVTEPFAQSWRRRDVLEPLVERGLLLAHTARPDAIDKNARAVGSCRFFVHALDLEFRHRREFNKTRAVL